MNNIETMKQWLEALELSHPRFGVGTAIHIKAVATLRQAIEQAQQEESKCNPHPKAPHGFNRNASHSNERYTCECEGWDAYEAGYQDGLQKGFEMEQAQQAEPDYYGLTKDHLWMSITKDHYDRLKPEFRMACYTFPPPRQPLTDEECDAIYNELDAWANDVDSYDFGLPHIAGGGIVAGREVIRRAIEAAHGIKGEA